MKKKLNWNLGCSLVLVVVLAASFLFYLWAQNLGKYTLQPGQSMVHTMGCFLMFFWQNSHYFSHQIHTITF